MVEIISGKYNDFFMMNLMLPFEQNKTKNLRLRLTKIFQFLRHSLESASGRHVFFRLFLEFWNSNLKYIRFKCENENEEEKIERLVELSYNYHFHRNETLILGCHHCEKNFQKYSFSQKISNKVCLYLTSKKGKKQAF